MAFYVDLMFHSIYAFVISCAMCFLITENGQKHCRIDLFMRYSFQPSKQYELRVKISCDAWITMAPPSSQLPLNAYP